MRKIILIGVGVIVLLLISVVGAAMFVNMNQFRPTLEQTFEGAVGRKVTLGTISLSVLGGTVSVNDVSIADDPKFGASPFVTAKAVKVAVEVWPLIVSRALNVQSFTLERPQITL